MIVTVLLWAAVVWCFALAAVGAVVVVLCLVGLGLHLVPGIDAQPNPDYVEDDGGLAVRR